MKMEVASLAQRVYDLEEELRRPGTSGVSEWFRLDLYLGDHMNPKIGGHRSYTTISPIKVYEP